MSKAKITLITLDYPPQMGGVARYLGNLVDHSAGAIKVMVPADHPAGGVNGVVPKPLFWALWPKWWPIARMSWNMERGTGIILVSHVFPVGTAVWISKMLGGPDYAVLFHGLDLKLASSVWKRWLLKRICGKAKALFTNSRATQGELLKLVPQAQATVVTPGIDERSIVGKDEARRRLNLDQQAKIVLSVTRLVPRKGIDLALHALSRLQTRRNVEYVVLGDGPDRTRLESEAQESRTKVRWIIGADDTEKWLWYAAADVFLLPVREEEQDMEGFGIVYLEAALAGLPSVAGKSGGAGEAVRHESTGLLVNPKSIDEVEAAVEQLLSDAELRHRLGAAGRKRALQDFCWADRWLAIRNVLGLKG